MSTNMPNLKQIGGGHCKTLVDLTWNDPNVRSVGKLIADLIAINKCGSDVVMSGVAHSHNRPLRGKSQEKPRAE